MLFCQRWAVLVSVLLQVAIAKVHVPVTPVSTDRAVTFQYVENTLPLAAQTHEVIMVPKTSVMLVSQMSNSVLIKARVDRQGVFQHLGAFQLGNNSSGLHGLAPSKAYKGKVWVTLQNDNLIVLLDPRVDDISAAPKVVKVIRVPKPGLGPHYVGEYGDELWSTMQTSSHVLRINHKDTDVYSIYKAQPKPVFIAKHPINGMFYTGQDDSSSVMQINPKTGETKQIAIPVNAGQTPVGMISGPLGIWFVLLGTGEKGTGTFGHIDADGKVKFHKLSSALGANASLLHLAIDPHPDISHTIWFLTSSIINPKALDSVIKVVFNPTYSEIIKEEVTVLPTQQCKAHRIWLTDTTVFATELTSSKVFAWSKAAAAK
ncbi:hypothetical protein DFQ27_006237 [Actinomortierella ambigua]|uniref:Methanethiol oxidase n=1 Tax=Actinomortierella ambigua TaxID=1343610 RepID=A0A9P6PZN0_9FUNG|nr:hypothetical protein DFQ27_006237 [Actinomortierella ambigua]